jgi:hypothetical protein
LIRIGDLHQSAVLRGYLRRRWIAKKARLIITGPCDHTVRSILQGGKCSLRDLVTELVTVVAASVRD